MLSKVFVGNLLFRNIEIIILQYSRLFELQIVPEIIQIVLEHHLNDENCLNFAKLIEHHDDVKFEIKFNLISSQSV